jgi:hypothetical protein
VAQPYAHTERSSGVYTATLLDEAGNTVTVLDTLEVWLRDIKTGTILNGRDGQSLLNANQGTFTAGTFTWAMVPADHAIVGGDGSQIEIHEAVFRATWDNGAKAKTWHVRWQVTNYPPITS